MQAGLQRAVEQALGSPVIGCRALSGGDINDAYAATLSEGSVAFIKTHAGSDPRMFEAEADGLAWLREAGALRVPKVLHVTPASGPPPYFLALEMLTPARPRHDFDVTLGQGLATLHQAGAPGYGWRRDNFIGRLPQSNAPCPTWTEFYGQRRLLAQLRTAEAGGRATRTMRRGIEGLIARLDDLLGPAEPPARLHGDLWGGNLHVDETGAPCLIDPAVYGGHREVDLAMMRLFGGFSERCFAAYHEAYPLAPGAGERVPIYQLYPLLVHVNLFGGSYVSSVERTVRRFA